MRTLLILAITILGALAVSYSPCKKHFAPSLAKLQSYYLPSHAISTETMMETAVKGDAEMCSVYVSRSFGPHHRHKTIFDGYEQITENCKKWIEGEGGVSAVVRTDANGKTCRMEIKNVPYCMGMCRTGEFGTYTTTFRQQNSSLCGYINPVFEEVTMTDCDEGADLSIRIVKLLSADAECGCVKVPPKEQ